MAIDVAFEKHAFEFTACPVERAEPSRISIR